MSKKYINVFKKHFFLLCSGFLILSLLFISGFLISYYFNDTQYIENFPDSRNIYLLIWRLVLYIALFFAWKPFVFYTFKNYAGFDKHEKVRYLIQYRKNVVFYILLFEAVVVQNLFGYLINVVL